MIFNTQLKDRTLWFDGSSSYDPQILHKVVRMHEVKYVDYINKDVQQYNQHVSKEYELTVKTQCDELVYDWNVPDEYKHLDVVEYITDKHLIMTSHMEPEEAEARDYRLYTELKLFFDRKFDDVLRTMIYIINKLTSDNIVWGVGRGSSVSSYVLYVIGVHDVDSYAYDLDINDFIPE